MKQLNNSREANHLGVSHVSDQTLRQFVGYNIKRTFNALHSDLVLTLRPYELRMITYTALVLIRDNPGLRQSQLADALAVERSNLVVIIDELERRELISRTPVLTDRRANALQVTLAGRRLCDKATAALQLHERSFLETVDQDAKETMLQVLNLIETNVKS
jgi:DNA-binding MarR family transcriptional regulator